MSGTPQGRTVVWCSACGRFHPGEPGRSTCPACGLPLRTVRCTRCGYEWTPLRGTPRTCANQSCRSPYYNRRRVR